MYEKSNDLAVCYRNSGYRRYTRIQIRAVRYHYKKDNKENRWRNMTIAFRVSPQENELINELVALSGMEKQEYIVNRLQNDTMNLTMNPRIYLRIVTILDRIYTAVIDGNNISDIDMQLLYVIANAIKNCQVTEKI